MVSPTMGKKIMIAAQKSFASLVNGCDAMLHSTATSSKTQTPQARSCTPGSRLCGFNFNTARMTSTMWAHSLGHPRDFDNINFDKYSSILALVVGLKIRSRVSILQIPSSTTPASETRREAKSLLLAWARRILRGLALLFLGSLAGLWLSYHGVGEAWPMLAALLYVPQQVFLLPFAVLIPPALLLDRRLCLVLLALLGPAVWMFLGPAWSVERRVPEDSIRLMTLNRGQHGNQSMRPFVESQSPDILLLQDAKGRAMGYRSAYPEYPFSGELDEFIVLSRFPIRASERIEHPGIGERPTLVAARFVLDIGGRQVAMYNVHLPTPRNALQGGGLRTLLLSAVPGTRGSRGEAGRQLRAFWLDRLDAVRNLNARIRADPLPALAAGDFNTPGLGRCNALLTRGLSDAHSIRGTGFGYTFPGISRNPLTLFGPWLRLDRVLAGKEWRIDAAVTEPDRPSQHRAFCASVRLPGLRRPVLPPSSSSAPGNLEQPGGAKGEP